MARLLFIVKRREGQWGYSTSRSSGLSNSVSFMVEALLRAGIEAKMVEVEDNNCIDREVTRYRPTHVIIEAFWVVPEKFDVLMRLHPGVSWIVRDHSETAFAASEGIIFKWVPQYMRRGVEVMCNSYRAVTDMAAVAIACDMQPSIVSYGPNVYLAKSPRHLDPVEPQEGVLNVGCFGAVRLLKNHLAQAIAALSVANTLGKKLRFHINATRIEGKSEPVLHNLQGLFANARNAELVEHPWEDHAGFLSLMRKERIEAVMQVSFTETFNIVAADAASLGIAVICSPEVPWLGLYAQADQNSMPSMADALYRAVTEPDESKALRVSRQHRDLDKWNALALHTWLARFRH